MPTLAVTFEPGAHGRSLIADLLGQAATPVFLTDLDDQARASALTAASAILARDTGKELRPHEPALIANARLIQFMTAGIDYIRLSELPPLVPVANNGGAYAGSMAEHALAMTLAAAKRILIEHNALIAGQFNQFTRNRTLAGKTCAILGFGGIGEATARLMRATGMRIHAINRRGHSEEPTDWIGTQNDLGTMLRAADVLVIAAPLTQRTIGMIGAAELALMKPDAIMVNLARGELIDEVALFAHLTSHKEFFACIDAWWIEPVRHGTFRMDHPFLTLPNVVGSPHNSASVPGNNEAALRHAIPNIRRALAGETPRNLIGAEERML
jgi:phosphoglycerate dehydrogenase-like enzyme